MLASEELPALLYFLNIQILKAFPIGKAFFIDYCRISGRGLFKQQ
jgi:hypothetical protein